MLKWRTLLAAVLIASLMVGSCIVGYIARRNSWVPRSTRQHVKAFVNRLIGADGESTVPETSTENWTVTELATPLPDDQADRLESLNALGYLDGYVAPISDATGVVSSDPEDAYGGYRLYVSGHAPEARLISTDGTLLHSWVVKLEDALPNGPPREAYARRFRRAAVYPDGALLVTFDLAGLVKIDIESHVIWAYQGGSHHDFEIQPDDTIWTIDADVDATDLDLKSVTDFIAHVSPEGRLLSRFSLQEAFERSQYASLLGNSSSKKDILHTNTIHILDASQRAMLGPLLCGDPGIGEPAAQHVALVSCRNIDTVALLDLDSHVVIWTLVGMWTEQHEPVMTDEGTLLVYDNASLGERSRVVDVDPVSQSLLWAYEGPAENPLNSLRGSACHLLPNGNILIVDTAPGRAIEVTRDKRIVWEFLSPHRIVRGGKELVANLYDMVPLSDDDVPFLRQ